MQDYKWWKAHTPSYRETHPQISAKHAAAIGYIAVHWSSLEDAINELIAQLLRTGEELGIAVTSELSIMQKQSMIAALLFALRTTKSLMSGLIFPAQLINCEFCATMPFMPYGQ